MSFLLPVLAIVICIISLFKMKKTHEEGIFLAVSGIFVSLILTFVLSYMIFVHFTLIDLCDSVDSIGNYGEVKDDAYCKNYLCVTKVWDRHYSRYCMVYAEAEE